MAAGLSLPAEKVEAFRTAVNENCQLTEEDFIPKVKVDIAMPVGYPNAALIKELEVLEPFGKGNTKPLFADKDLKLKRALIVGKNRNALRLELETPYKEQVFAVYFGDVEAFLNYYGEKFGKEEVKLALEGKNNKIFLKIVYYPEINRYNGTESIQIMIRNYQ